MDHLSAADGVHVRRSHPALAVLIAYLLAVVPTGLAYGQGFMVKPMRVDVTPGPGEELTVPIEVRSTSGNELPPIRISLYDLSQTSEGNWLLVEPGVEVDTASLLSCREWVELGQDRFNLEPLQTVQVPVTIKTPRDARGTYLAALIVETEPPQNPQGLVVRVRFLIPIVAEIKGRPVRQNVTLSGVSMSYRESSPQQPATTLVGMTVANEGRTYSRIYGNIEVHSQWKERWRKVASVAVDEVGIIPGVTLHLTSDLERRLPSGRYKLMGTLYVDGRRLKPLEQEIDFKGDPNMTRLAIDSALLLDPLEVLISGRPGAARTALLRVENASEDAVEIEATVAVPPTLQGVALNEMRGTELACTQWLSVVPAKFTIRGGATQNIRVLARLPREGMTHPSYYGLIQLSAHYPDGQSAGRTNVLARVRNEDMKAEVEGQVVKANLAASGEAGQYVVQARFANVGEIDFLPVARAMLMTGRGVMAKQVRLEGDEGIMLPLETRDFAGVLDFTDIEPGVYALQVQLDLPEGKAVTEQLPVRVEEENGVKVVTLIQPTEVAEAPSDGGEGQP